MAEEKIALFYFLSYSLSIILLGFLGDAISGGNLIPFPKEDTVIAWIIHYISQGNQLLLFAIFIAICCFIFSEMRGKSDRITRGIVRGK